MKHFLARVIIFLTLSSLLSACAVWDGYDPATGLVFQDDFRDPSSGWPVQADDLGRLEYQDGRYEIAVTAPGLLLSASLPPGYRIPPSVQVDVLARAVSGALDNRFGVLCRYQDEQNFYFFAISSDGYYGIGQMVDGQASFIGQEQMLPSEAIRQGTDTEPNYLHVECASRLRFLVNGVLLAEVDAPQVNSAASGVGLFAAGSENGGTVASFERFMVSVVK